MAKSLHDWINEDVAAVRDKPVRWLSEHHFFRDPIRPHHSDTTHFFAPADGIILYQDVVGPDQKIVDIKGKAYSLRDAMRDPDYARPSLVIGIFMTFYDVHINRIPLPGRLCYRLLDPIETYNLPMLDVEKALIDEGVIRLTSASYLRSNQRMINRVFSSTINDTYYMLQIADYDVDSIMPFNLQQNQPFHQNQRFSQIRYGSQVELIVPLSDRYGLQPTLEPGLHVEAGVDPLIRITNL
jgi:phosphatidylserine decarboxylase